MGFPVKQRQDLISGKGKGGFTKALMYNLYVNGDSNSPEEKFTYTDANGKTEQLFGRYEPVIFLTELDYAPTITFHRHKKKDKVRVLSGQMFEDIDSCPASQYFKDNKENPDVIISGAVTELCIPVLGLRRQKSPVNTKAGGAINPVNWFELGCAEFIDTQYASYLRLVAADQEFPIHEYAYKIRVAMKKGSNAYNYYFDPMKDSSGKPIKLVPQVLDKLIIVDHPLISDWVDKGRFIWDQDYYQMVMAFAILKFQKFTHPQTGETFDYNGHYEEALEIFKQYADTFPPAAEAVEEEAY